MPMKRGRQDRRRIGRYVRRLRRIAVKMGFPVNRVRVTGDGVVLDAGMPPLNRVISGRRFGEPSPTWGYL